MACSPCVLCSIRSGHPARFDGGVALTPSLGGVQIDFSARARLFRQDDWAYLELFLVNRSNVTVWVQEAVVVLSNLEANWQTSISTGQARHKVLQNIRPSETLGVSLVGSIYEAAGRPQGRYSCLVYIEVHFRFDDEWFSKILETYKVEMVALSVHGLHRLRWYEKKASITNHPA